MFEYTGKDKSDLRRTSTSSPSWISKFLVLILEVCWPITKVVDQNLDRRLQGRASMFQDGEDVDDLRSPVSIFE